MQFRRWAGLTIGLLTRSVSLYYWRACFNAEVYSWLWRHGVSHRIAGALVQRRYIERRRWGWWK